MQKLYSVCTFILYVKKTYKDLRLAIPNEPVSEEVFLIFTPRNANYFPISYSLCKTYKRTKYKVALSLYVCTFPSPFLLKTQKLGVQIVCMYVLKLKLENENFLRTQA